MARIALISDIHGNLHALQSVLMRLGRLQVDEVICLGDVVGYGPDPGPCMDLVVRTCSTIIRGNHDEAAVNPRLAEQFNGAARQAIIWTRDNLRPMHLGALNQWRPVAADRPGFMCVHDCPYPGPTDYVYDRQVAALAFRGVERPICFLGHTHVPMVFETSEPESDAELAPQQVCAYVMPDGAVIELREGFRYICNPGSVGQPRDCDPRASFAIFDESAKTFAVHREPYDIDAVQAATQAAGLPSILAERLAIGA